MPVGVLTVRLAIYGATSLKDKRRVVKSLKDKIANRFNVSVAETDALQARQSAVLMIAQVSNSWQHCEQSLQAVLNFITQHHGASMIDYQLESR